MPNHVKKILNRAYLEDNPYNDIVLHLEREMRLNGLGAPDETTLVRLNAVDVARTEPKKSSTNEETVSTVANMGIIRHNAVKYEKIATMKLKHRTAFPTPMNHPNLNAILVENSTKLKTAGTELMRRMTLGKNDTSSPYPRAKLENNRPPLLKFSQKTENAAPPLRGNGRRKGVRDRRPPK